MSVSRKDNPWDMSSPVVSLCQYRYISMVSTEVTDLVSLSRQFQRHEWSQLEIWHSMTNNISRHTVHNVPCSLVMTIPVGDRVHDLHIRVGMSQQYQQNWLTPRDFTDNSEVANFCQLEGTMGDVAFHDKGHFQTRSARYTMLARNDRRSWRQSAWFTPAPCQKQQKNSHLKRALFGCTLHISLLMKYAKWMQTKPASGENFSVFGMAQV